ncbi:recombinase family protein [Rhodococcus sp. IEGM 1408]|uniref:recombinase family protein n=1 Tax=Rhodococcus sp. IEGM 1408 TaxID=3082220 RepID=UPI0029533604|nr:recombinase family protein [Rhodococcus sp. IEGM 1408]MDV8003177.1 recombinase family protein [Rhodococcus sp. IEGM 1408]
MTAPRKPRKRRPAAPADAVVGYLRVSTEEQAVSGLGLDAQRAAVEARAAVEGWHVVAWFTDEGVSGTVSPLERPGLAAALDAVAEGKASRLVASHLSRIGRSAARVLDLDALAAAEGWGLVMCDIQIDTGTAAGRFMLGNMAAAAEYERNLVSERTKAALAVKRAQGVRLGRPSTLDRAVVARIVTERDAGSTWQAVADRLMADEVATAQGGARWHPASVRKVYIGQDAAQLRAAADAAEV